MSIGKTVPLGKVKSSSILPFHFPVNPIELFSYEGNIAVTIVKRELFAALLTSIPVPKGVDMEKVLFSEDRIMLLSSRVSFSWIVNSV